VEIKLEHLEEGRKLSPEDDALAELHAVRLAIYEAWKHLTVREAMA
jgi:hypothetical protein